MLQIKRRYYTENFLVVDGRSRMMWAAERYLDVVG